MEGTESMNHLGKAIVEALGNEDVIQSHELAKKIYNAMVDAVYKDTEEPKIRVSTIVTAMAEARALFYLSALPFEAMEKDFGEESATDKFIAFEAEAFASLFPLLLIFNQLEESKNKTMH